MYRYNVNEENIFCDTILYEGVILTIDSSKLFHLDEFNILKDNTIDITYSQIRTNQYIAGVLDLTTTHGKENNKYLYLCKPDDNRINTFLISYKIPPNFDKSIKYLYITFKYLHWDNEYPYGVITFNIGRVEILNNLYEYMLYCKSLNQPIQKFTKKSIDVLNKHKDIINEITNKYNLPYRTGHIFTIDSIKSLDYDDAISINDNIISVYISHVPIILDYLNLWDSFSRRVSSIYLPDKKRSMLPNVLSERICSLKEKENRICLVLDIHFENDIITKNEFSICNTKVSRNYHYEQDKLLNHKDYLNIKNILKVDTTYQVISKLMIHYNTECAKRLKTYNQGIFKTINSNFTIPKTNKDYIELFKVNSSKYKINYSLEQNNCYLQITSPIRRLVDLLNMYKFTNIYSITNYSNNASKFYNKWLNDLDYINITMRYIRKIQSKCNLISIFENNKNEIFQGVPFDKLERSDKKYHYNVYLPRLNIFTSITSTDDLNEYEKYLFKLYMFNSESKLKKKIKISLYIS
jgi:exoribonuclease R